MPGDQNTAVPAVYAIGAENEQRHNRENNKPIKKRNKCFLTMVTVIVVLFAGLFATLFMLYRYMHQKSDSSNAVICDSADCVRLAAVFKKTMDPSADPCDNFAKYACGKWSQSYLKPDAYVGYSWFEYIHRRQTSKLRDLLRQNLTDVYGAKLPLAVLQAQKLYNSCVDTETLDKLGLEPLVDQLKKFELPKWPPAFVDGDNSSDLVRQAARVKRYLYKDVFFKVEVYIDLRNVTKNLIVIGSPTSEKSFRSWSDHYIDDKLRTFLKITPNDAMKDKNQSLDEDIDRIFMRDVIREMMSSDHDDDDSCRQILTEEEEDRLDDLVEQLLDLDDYIFNNENSTENGTTPFDDTYEYDELPEEQLMHVEELQKLTDEYVRTINPELEPQEIWKPFIDELFKGVLKPGWRARYKLWVYDLEHLQRVAALFASGDKKLLETMTWWTVIQTLAQYSSRNLRGIYDDYSRQMYELESSHSRSIQCVSVVNSLMGMASSWLYFDEKFHDKDLPQIQEMVRYIKSAFANLVITSDWLDRATKLAILRKNSQPIAALGYPEWLFARGKVDEFYGRKLKVAEDTFLQNIMGLLEIKIRAELASLKTGNPKGHAFWIEPIVINAFHVYDHNQIIIPGSILRFPFYTSSLKSLNYGLIGAGVIGHELAHGFDDLGRRFDEFGNLKQWWSNETIAEYVSRAKCYVDHYSGYYIEEVEAYVNGEATLNENLADVLGLKQAFVGYQHWKERHEQEPKLPGFTDLTHEQLFFLSYAVSWCHTHTPMVRLLEMSDIHAPNDIRMLGTLRNSKEFSDAWHCPVGSYMNPEDKCTLW